MNVFIIYVGCLGFVLILLGVIIVFVLFCGLVRIVMFIWVYVYIIFVGIMVCVWILIKCIFVYVIYNGLDEIVKKILMNVWCFFYVEMGGFVLII